jgi:hypothetical protein
MSLQHIVPCYIYRFPTVKMATLGFFETFVNIYGTCSIASQDTLMVATENFDLSEVDTC